MYVYMYAYVYMRARVREKGERECVGGRVRVHVLCVCPRASVFLGWNDRWCISHVVHYNLQFFNVSFNFSVCLFLFTGQHVVLVGLHENQGSVALKF